MISPVARPPLNSSHLTVLQSRRAERAAAPAEPTAARKHAPEAPSPARAQGGVPRRGSLINILV